MENIGKYDDMAFYRFQCDCLVSLDAMDLEVDKCPNDGKYITINMTFRGSGLKDRIKYAFQILRGDWNWREFAVRAEDAKPLSDILNPDKKYSQLP